MVLLQFLHSDPVGISYLLGCSVHRICAVVDAADDPDVYLRLAKEAEMRIAFVVDTHVHTDHVSFGSALAEATGAAYVLSSVADVIVPFLGVDEGDAILVGDVTAKVLHTPGHTPEHICLVVSDRARGDEPWFVLTGHTLLVGGVGTPELATSAKDGARILYRSMQKLAALPDYVEVLPGAGAGWSGIPGLSGKPWSTIGFEKRHNAAFRLQSEREFVDHLLATAPPTPLDAQIIRAVNASGPSDHQLTERPT
ncbi:MBL fold metallo-hydrolase [Mesorhizobium sp.]|uniref:MBL fold metallo-hydrolase n=1 Tax=Mesorhizobium sp. TaxID=1871066 RepID=UPI0025DC35CF|nr:MBL fold metallo-hydrolase [Mesorhizobium sp.]